MNRNLGNTADDASFRGLHLELRRAFDLIAEKVDLEACCEQYVFPVEEERVWERAPPSVRPTLTRSRSQSGRAGPMAGLGGGNRGGQPRLAAPSGPRGASSGRRGSSSAAFGVPSAGVLPFPPPLTLSAHEAYRAGQIPPEIQDQLYQWNNALQQQEQELRLMQAQNQAASQAAQQQQQSQQSQQQQQRGEGSGRRSSRAPPARLTAVSASAAGPAFENAPHTAPLRPQMFYYPLHFSPTPPVWAPSMGIVNAGGPQIMTPPPQEARIVARPQTVEGTDGAGLRSHSQPARPVRGAGLRLQTIPARSPSRNGTARMLPGDSSRGQNHMGEGDPSGASTAPMSAQSSHRAATMTTGMSSARGDETPKEYVGYYVGRSPGSLRRLEDAVLRAVPTFGDLPPAIPTQMMSAGAVNANAVHGAQFNGTGADMARSQSVTESAYEGLRTPPSELRSAPPAGVSTGSPERRGPLIVDGSGGKTPRKENQRRQDYASDGGNQHGGGSVEVGELGRGGGDAGAVQQSPVEMSEPHREQPRRQLSPRIDYAVAAAPPLPIDRPNPPNGLTPMGGAADDGTRDIIPSPPPPSSPPMTTVMVNGINPRATAGMVPAEKTTITTTTLPSLKTTNTATPTPSTSQAQQLETWNTIASSQGILSPVLESNSPIPGVIPSSDAEVRTHSEYFYPHHAHPQHSSSGTSASATIHPAIPSRPINGINHPRRGEGEMQPPPTPAWMAGSGGTHHNPNASGGNGITGTKSSSSNSEREKGYKDETTDREILAARSNGFVRPERPITTTTGGPSSSAPTSFTSISSSGPSASTAPATVTATVTATSPTGMPTTMMMMESNNNNSTAKPKTTTNTTNGWQQSLPKHHHRRSGGGKKSGSGSTTTSTSSSTGSTAAAAGGVTTAPSTGTGTSGTGSGGGLSGGMMKPVNEAERKGG